MNRSIAAATPNAAPDRDIHPIIWSLIIANSDFEHTRPSSFHLREREREKEREREIHTFREKERDRERSEIHTYRETHTYREKEDIHTYRQRDEETSSKVGINS